MIGDEKIPTLQQTQEKVLNTVLDSMLEQRITASQIGCATLERCHSNVEKEGALGTSEEAIPREGHEVSDRSSSTLLQSEEGSGAANMTNEIVPTISSSFVEMMVQEKIPSVQESNLDAKAIKYSDNVLESETVVPTDDATESVSRMCAQVIASTTLILHAVVTVHNRSFLAIHVPFKFMLSEPNSLLSTKKDSQKAVPRMPMNSWSRVVSAHLKKVIGNETRARSSGITSDLPPLPSKLLVLLPAKEGVVEFIAKKERVAGSEISWTNEVSMIGDGKTTAPVTQTPKMTIDTVDSPLQQLTITEQIGSVPPEQCQSALEKDARIATSEEVIRMAEHKDLDLSSSALLQVEKESDTERMTKVTGPTISSSFSEVVAELEKKPEVQASRLDTGVFHAPLHFPRPEAILRTQINMKSADPAQTPWSSVSSLQVPTLAYGSFLPNVKPKSARLALRDFAQANRFVALEQSPDEFEIDAGEIQIPKSKQANIDDVPNIPAAPILGLQDLEDDNRFSVLADMADNEQEYNLILQESFNKLVDLRDFEASSESTIRVSRDGKIKEVRVGFLNENCTIYANKSLHMTRSMKSLNDNFEAQNLEIFDSQALAGLVDYLEEHNPFAILDSLQEDLPETDFRTPITSRAEVRDTRVLNQDKVFMACVALLSAGDGKTWRQCGVAASVDEWLMCATEL
ncbi:hypothetical protein HDU93_003541 [Gonapodya sp. JEL0774]|nr:hypothetical protein HDU93_003541 [Gonapodya sp. JEL0774]